MSDTKEPTLAGQIVELAKRDPTVAHYYKHYLQDEAPYEHMLEALVLHLAKEKHTLYDRLVETTNTVMSQPKALHFGDDGFSKESKHA